MNSYEAAIVEALPSIVSDLAVAPSIEPGDADTIPEGQRDSTLTQVAGQLRHLGFGADAITALLRVENQRRCKPPLSDFEVSKIARSVARYAPSKALPSPLVGFTLADLVAHRFPTRRAILTRADTPVLRAGHLGQIYAERGIGKTWFMQTLALVAATGTTAMGFSASPCRVLYIDGEMASEELQDRFIEICQHMGISTTSPVPLTVVGADWQDHFLPRLDTDAGQLAVEPFVDDADLIFLDNRSSLFNPEGEKDPTAWEPAQAWLLGLRRRGKAVMMGHHSNRMGGARGHSKAEDVLNLMIQLERPDGYQADEGARFLATFKKTRGVYGAAVADFVAHLTPDGWSVSANDESHTTADRLLQHVRAADEAGERLKSANAAIRAAGVNRLAGLNTWRDLAKSGAITRHPEGGFRAS
ncbi:MAG TPA: AAA family ATPase [Vicinamibacterales bacterium]|nr:AAA family ATPase [Vicinamibacterales bacterium]